jgi:hypothetical protein
VDGFGPPMRLLRRQLGHELRPSRVRVSVVEYKRHLIEAFEDQPGRCLSTLERLDGQNITGTEDAIEFAKEAIGGSPDS